MQSIVCCWCMLLVLKTSAVSIKFFADKNLTNLILESNSTLNCNNVLRDKTRVWLTYIKTDTCLMVYRYPNCQSTASLKILPGIEDNLGYGVESFHICNKNDGGSALNIDITKYIREITDFIPDVIHSFRNVCSCVNIPRTTLGMDHWSINNHGNEVLAYYEPDCKQTKRTATLIDAGSNYISRDPDWGEHVLSRLPILKFQSLGPNPNSLYFRTSCNPNLILLDINFSSSADYTEGDFSFQKDSDAEPRKARLEFYAHPNFEGFLFETEVNADCNNLPKPSDPNSVNIKIESLKANTCFVMFTDYDCVGRSKKIGSPGKLSLKEGFENGNFREFQPKSFHLCNSSVGGPQLNIDVTEYGMDTSKTNPLNVLQSYRDICNCKKLPLFIQNKNGWSVNNYANSLVAYFEPDCLSNELEPVWIPAGYGILSKEVGRLGRTEKYTGIIQKIQSLGPDPNAQYFKNHCIKLDSTIIKFEIIEPNDDIREQNMEMTASKTVFHNNGSTELTEKYSASTSVHESFQIEIGSSLSNMNRVQVDAYFDLETKKGTTNSATQTSETSQGWENSNTTATSKSKEWGVGGSASFNLFGVQIGGGGGYTSTTGESNQNTNTLSGSSSQGNAQSNSIFQQASFRQGLRKAYETSGTKSTSDRITATVENTRTFTKTQEINVPACTEHVVNAYVKVVTNKRVEYRALTKISGRIGDQKMTSAEVRKLMDSKLEYVSDFDDRTVLAYSKGTFRAEYGTLSFISSEGSTLHDCMARLSRREMSCPKCNCSPCAVAETEPLSSRLAHPFMAYAGIF